MSGPTQRERVLALLREAGDRGVSSGEFAEGGILRFGQRLAELREAGFVIQTQRLASNRFRYFLKLAAPPGRDGAEPVPARSGATSDGTGAGASSPPPGSRASRSEQLVIRVDAREPDEVKVGYEWRAA